MYKIISTLAFSMFLFILWMIYLANTEGENILLSLSRSVPYGDKFGHAVLFGGLALIATIASKFRCFYFFRCKLYGGVLAVTIFAVAEEISQIFIPSRTFDLLDLAADSIGIMLAIVCSSMLNKLLTDY